MLALLADVGGTNTRLQLSRINKEGEDVVICRQNYKSASYYGLKFMVRDFLDLTTTAGTPQLACVAVAGPVEGDRVVLTNLPWNIEAGALAAELGIARVFLVNDVAACAYAVNYLTTADSRILHAGAGKKDSEPRLVINVGTGYGQALLLTGDNGCCVLASEGGHVDFAPHNSFGLALLEKSVTDRKRATLETFLSGAGLLRMYHYVRSAEIDGSSSNATVAKITTADLINLANDGDDAALHAVEQFVNLLASQVLNAELTYMPRGGVYLVGGLLRALQNYYRPQIFTEALSKRPEMNRWLNDIPVQLVINEHMGLIGAGKAAQVFWNNSKHMI